MVRHELTVFPDGRVDGAVCVREGDYRSHTLHFVFAEGLTAASAKLMVWAAGEETPTLYDTAKGDGSCTAQDAAFTPVLWQGVGRTRLQLELLDSAGDVIWQSRRFTAAVEEGVPEDAKTPPVTDTSDATLLAADAPYGKVFYGADGRAVGQVPDNRVKPRGWSKIPIMSVRTQVGAHYFQRVSDDLLTVFVPSGFSDTPPLFFKMRSEGLIGSVSITVGGTNRIVDLGAQQMITVSFPEGADAAIFVLWQDAEGAHTKALRLRMVKATNSSHGVLTVTNATADNAGGTPDIVSRMCENAGYVNGISLSGDTAQVVLTCAGARAYAVYRGCGYGADADKKITIPAVSFAEGFAQIDMIDPATGYRMPYFLSRQLEDGTITASILARPECALAFLDEDAQFYDYNANGYGPPIAAMTALRDSVESLDGVLHNYIGREKGPWRPTDSGNFAQQSMDTASTLFDLVGDWLTENGCEADTDDNDDVTALCYTGETPVGEGSLGKGSRWLVFVNGRAVTAPGFLANVLVNPNLRLELVYTCADGIDVGFPYAGA